MSKSEEDRQDFYLYERKRPGKPAVWYARFRSDDGKRIGSPMNTHKGTEEEARHWAQKQLRSGRIPDGKPAKRTFEEWSAPWWNVTTCPYCTAKLADGYHLSPAYVDARRSYLDGYLIPAFGKIPVGEITSTMCQDYKLRLFREGRLRPGSINRIMGTLRVMFRYAVDMKELPFDPMKPVKELAENERQRGILSLAELAKLFRPNALEEVWNGEPRHYAMNLLAASTGMRLGECQALMVKDIAEGGFILVDQSWDDRHGMGQPKWNSQRWVPVPTKTASAIDSLLSLKRWGPPLPDDVVFWGADRNTPISKTAVLKFFKGALGRIGIADEQRAARNLVFHSYRHTYETIMRGRVPDEQLRRIIGHKSIAMSDRYDRPQPEHLGDVKAVQETIFAGP